MTTNLYSIVLAAALSVSAAIVDAQSMSKMIRDTGLTQEDFNLMTQTGAALYETGAPQVGPVRTWSNPDTGARGDVRLDAAKDGCVVIHHRFEPGNDRPARQLRTRRCKDAGGTWILTP